MVNFLLVGIGGFLGTILRYAVGLACSKYNFYSFPLATWIVNLSGSFILGLLTGWLARHESGHTWRLLIGTGLCGGYTTFSTLALESYELIESKMIAMSVVYGISSLVGGVLLAGAGVWIGKSIF